MTKEMYTRKTMKVIQIILFDRKKWKKHFSEMKGDVGMSLHIERQQEDAYTETECRSLFITKCSCSVV